MDLNKFIGRNEELASLSALLKKKQANLVVIRGRRRIGKSSLVEAFAGDKIFFSFTGLAPMKETTAQDQRNEFSRQLGEKFGLQTIQASDWGDLFSLLSKLTVNNRAVILLDEISWMGSKDANFLGKLKIAWDLLFSKNSQLTLILCGSVSAWIEENILSGTAFFGRVSLKISLDELTLLESNLLLERLGVKASSYEKFMLLGITGGVPWYLSLINPSLSATENIQKLCFEPEGILVEEFRYIFHDLFGKRGAIYQKIVQVLAKGPAEYGELASALQYASSGPLSAYLEELILSGFISRAFSWDIKTGKESKLSQYRLKDNYLRFYIRYLLPNLGRIKKGQYGDFSVSSLPGFDSMMGLQFENTILNNRKLIQRALGIKPEEIVADGSFFQRKTSKQDGCQIDYLIQTRFGSLYVCEIKFSRKPIGQSVMQEVQDKIKHLKHPKGFACIPVLIYLGELTTDLEDSDYFSKKVSMLDF